MTTTNLGMTLPTVGASTDTWGDTLNVDLNLIDAFATRSTRQVFLSGTAQTYTTPPNCRQLRIRMVGGGGGGASNSAPGGTNGSAGGASSLNSVTANGGTGGSTNSNPGAGGSGGSGSPTGMVRIGGGGGGQV